MAADSSSQTFDKLSALCHEWLQYDPNPATRSEIEKLFAAAKDEHEKGTKPSPNLTLLGERMLVRIAFGTAGLRARMAAGYACMNDLVIIQTSQGLGKHLLATHSLEDCAKRGVIVGYDGRHNSRKYAEITSAVFLSMGISVHLFNRLTCTPMVPFSVLEFKAVAGVMVTASHNPKDDNGYKVYWENGAQIIPPLDAHIAAAIRENLKPWQAYVFDPKHPLLKDPTDAATAKYFGEIEKRYCWTRELNPTADLKITFTPMHGVGGYWSSLAFKSFHLPPFIPVPEQIEPDPEFSTVKFPNPEEGKGALALAMKCAEAHGSTVIIANDPDADRLAAAEFDTAAKQWVIFNGNQIAVLLSDWVFQNWTKHYPVADKSKLFMLNSTVSSKYLHAMARAEGFHYQDTLTGFKWMGNVASDLIKKGLTFLFAYEVEIGFLVGDLSLDKDGVRLAAIFAEMANHVYKSGKSLNQHLETLYKKYGFFEMNTSYFFCYTAEGFERVFGRLRSGNNGSYVDTCGPFKIKSVRDVTLGLDTSRDDKKSLLPATPDSQMLTFYFEDGSTATLRNSGTEPKLKYYVECSDKESRQNARAKVDELTKYIISEFLQPEKNGLVPKPAA